MVGLVGPERRPSAPDARTRGTSIEQAVQTVGWRTVGRSDVRIGSLGFGAAALGGLYERVEAADAVAVIRRAVDLDVGLIDVAPLYGVGLAEQRVGEGLAALPAGTALPPISTKVGRVLVDGAAGTTIFADEAPRHAEFDLSERGIRTSLESSLERLGVDRVDLCFLHDPDDREDEALRTAFPAMRRLRDEGVVGAIGAGMNQAGALERFIGETDIDVVLLAGRWTLLEHDAATRRLLDRCAADGVAVVLGGVLNTGLLAGGTTYDYVAAPVAVVARRDRLARVCADHDVDLARAAIRFGLGHPAVATVLVGARSVAEIETAAAAIREPMPTGLWDDLRDRGLIDDDIPTPS